VQRIGPRRMGRRTAKLDDEPPTAYAVTLRNWT
jgi:hypothetical protein